MQRVGVRYGIRLKVLVWFDRSDGMLWCSGAHQSDPAAVVLQVGVCAHTHHDQASLR